MTSPPQQVIDAARALVDKLDVIAADPQNQGVWTLAHAHGIRYSGPTYEKELAALRSVLEVKDE